MGLKLSLDEFLARACALRSFGDALLFRDLKEIYGQPAAAVSVDDQGKTAEAIQRCSAKKLAAFRGMTKAGDSQNDALNLTAWFAARAQAVLGKTEAQLKDELRKTAEASGHCKQIESTLDSGWDSGIATGHLRSLI